MRSRLTWIDDLNRRALRAALDTARSLGIECHDPVVMKDSYNAVIHLRPSPVVARVATLTGLVRVDVEEHIRREIAVVDYLAARSAAAAVAPPTRTIPPGPYESEGLWLSLWEYIPHTPRERPADAEVAPRLAQLHGLLRGYSGPSVPLDAAFDDLDRLVALLGEAPVPSPADVDLLGSEMARARAWLAAARTDHPQALHGDAHAGNMLVTPGGTVWVDFEETCVGPVEWDLACLTYRHSDPGHLVDRYVEAGGHRMRNKANARGGAARQTDCNVDALLPFIGARWVEAVAWTSYLAIHRPDRRKDAGGFAREWLDWLRRRGG